MDFNFTLPEGGPWFFFVIAMTVIVMPLLAERLGVPGIIGLLLGGFIIGQHGAELISEDVLLQEFGAVGLLYLMFLAGLELDLNVFMQVRRISMFLGAFTFSVPFALGTGVALLLGNSLQASILIGSFWASYTLVVYPVFRRFGLASNRAIAATVGATVITDTLALVVLAVISGTASSDQGGFTIGLEIALGLAILVGYCFLVLPAITRWFFTGVGQERSLRFVYALAAFLSAAVVADEVGIEGLVGSFAAGLALNRLIPNGSALMERIEFFGSAFFVPIFLISVGLLLEPRVLFSLETIGIGLAFTAALLVGKIAAAWLTGHQFGLTRSEIGAIFSLSSAQAAATLAAAVVGLQLELYDAVVLNAVLIVVVASLLISSISANRFGAAIPPPEALEKPLGGAIILPLRDLDGAEERLAFAARVSASAGGLVIPVHVVSDAGHNPSVESQRRLIEEIEALASGQGIDTEPVLRVDRAVTSGIRNTIIERDGSLLILPLPEHLSAQQIVFGGPEIEIVAASPIPTALVSLDGPVERVLLPLAGLRQGSADLQNARLAAELAEAFDVGDTALVIALDDPAAEVAGLELPADATRRRLDGSPLAWAGHEARAGDMIILPGDPGSLRFDIEATRLTSKPGVSLAIIAAPHRAGTFATDADLGTQVVARTA